MHLKQRLVLWSVVLVVVFLLGFVPQFLKSRRLSSELAAAQQGLETCRMEREMAEARDLAALMFLEVSRRNFGVASEHSRRFFDLAQELAAEAEDPARRQDLSEILEMRDSVTGGLASGDAAVAADVQTLLLRTHAATIDKPTRK